MSLSAILESQASQLLHPAIDVQGDLLGYGFRTAGGNVHVVSEGGKIVGSSDLRAQLGDRTVQWEQRKGSLVRLDDQWNRDDLRQFLAAPAALSGRALYDKHRAAWQIHVDLDHPGKYVILVCWGLMTYVYPTFSSLPFLHFLGPKGTGKSQSLDLLAALSRDGYKSRATAAVVGDLIESRRVTLLFDQANSMSPEHVDLFADSYRAGARRTIVNMDKRGVPYEFETFGPKTFAGIQPLDPDLADRTILITTTPASRTLEPVGSHDPIFADLRAQSYRWALVNYWRLVPVVEMLGSNSQLAASVYTALHSHRGRQRDLWLPIEVMMEMLEVPEEDRVEARDYYQRSQTSTKAELPADTVDLLLVLAGLVGEKSTVSVSSADLLRRLPGWTAIKLGKRLKSLALLAREPEREDRNHVRMYEVDGSGVRSLIERYAIKPTTGGDAR